MSHEALGFPGISGIGSQNHITTDGEQKVTYPQKEKKWRQTEVYSPEGDALLTEAALQLHTANVEISRVCTVVHFGL